MTHQPLMVLVTTDSRLAAHVTAALQKDFRVTVLWEAAAFPTLPLHDPAALVIVDVQHLDGDAVDRCRELRERISAPLLVAVEPHAERRLLSVFDLGIDGFLIKPASPHLLSSAWRPLFVGVVSSITARRCDSGRIWCSM